MRRFLVLALLSVLFLSIMIFSSGFLIKGRFIQLDNAMEKLSFSLQASPTFNITGRIKLLMNRLKGSEDPIKDLTMEARLQALASGISLYTNRDTTEQQSWPVLIRFYDKIGVLLGRTSMNLSINDDFMPVLDEAYFWERNRYYNKAIKKYKILKNTTGIHASIKDYIDLHIGFCLMMSGDYPGTTEKCSNLLKNQNNPEIIRTAKKILDFIDQIKLKHNEITTNKIDNIDSGRESFICVDYSGAILIFERFLIENSGHPRQNEARYYKARSHEELGQTIKAVEEYQRVIILGKTDNWTTRSKQRLLMLNNFYNLDIIIPELSSYIKSDIKNPDVENIADQVSVLIKTQKPENIKHVSFSENINKSAKGELFVQSNPSGASIQINGNDAGFTPLFLTELPYGKVHLKALLGGIEQSREIIIDVQEIIPVNLNFKKTEGTVKIISSWQSCRIYLDNNLLKDKNAVIRGISPGKHELIVIGNTAENKPGFYEISFNINAGEEKIVEIP